MSNRYGSYIGYADRDEAGHSRAGPSEAAASTNDREEKGEGRILTHGRSPIDNTCSFSRFFELPSCAGYRCKRKLKLPTTRSKPIRLSSTVTLFHQIPDDP
jgi:hypothetical protein